MPAAPHGMPRRAAPALAELVAVARVSATRVAVAPVAAATPSGATRGRGTAAIFGVGIA